MVTPTVHLNKYYRNKRYYGVQEGLNLTIIEALASGIPVIASDSGGMPELLTAVSYTHLNQHQNFFI